MRLIDRMKNTRLNFFILPLIFLLGFSVLYFLYNRQRSQAWIYVEGTVARPQNITYGNVPYNWTPYWIARAISTNSQEINPFGTVTAIVVDKREYEAPLYGKYIYLEIKVNTQKDRSGVYLYKNKPVVVGSQIDFKFANVQVPLSITKISEEISQHEYKKMRIVLKGREMEPWLAEAVKIGSVIKDGKGNVIAEWIDKKVSPAEVRVDTATGKALISYDQRKRDVEATVDVVVKDVNGLYFFMETQKVKVYETIYLPFPEVGNLSLPIMRLVSQQPVVIQ